MSIFGGKKTREEVIQAGGKPLLIPTGGKIDEVTMALITHFDSELGVRESVDTGLYDIGRRKPELVLSSILEFLSKNPKAPIDHRVHLLKTANQILELKRDELPEDLCLDLIALAMAEMHREKEVIPEWQGASSVLLVSLGMRFPKQIMEELMKKFAPGSIPHYFVMKTLGDFAGANANDVVPMLKELFARVLPVLAAIKAENMKWVFASAIGYFCEAIIAYSANHAGREGALGLSNFTSEVFPAYEVLFNNWLGSKEVRVRLATIQDQFEAQLPKIIQMILSMLKSEKEHLPILQGLSVVMESAVKISSQVLLTQLPAICMALHPLVCSYQNMPTPPQPELAALVMKTQNELLRCFEILGRTYTEQVISFLLKSFENKEPGPRTGSLRIIKHLVTRLDDVISEDKKRSILTGILPLIQQDKQRRVRKMLAETTIAMASKNYLLLEGGQSYVEFVLRNASITEAEVSAFDAQKGKTEDNVSPAELRSMCDDVLRLFTTTIPQMHRVLWPYLFENITKLAYTDSMGAVCKGIAFIGTQKRAKNDEDYLINYDKQVNVPKPQAIIARLLVLLNTPFRRNQLGLQILEALRASGPVLHPALANMWDSALPKLAAIVDKKGADWNQASWEELVLRLLAETIKIANDDEWTKTLGDQYSQQLELYKGEVELKKCALKHLGLVLQKLNHKDFIKARLDVMFQAVDHSNDVERLGYAQGIGFCAASHLDIVLERLEDNLKKAPQESDGLMSLFSSKPKAPGGPAVNSILLAYGYTAAYAPPGLIPSRIEVQVLNQMKLVLTEAKSPVIKESAIKAIDLIGKAMNQSHLKKKHPFPQRDDLIKIILGYIQTFPAPETPANLVVLALGAISTLVLLDPLSKELEAQLVEKTLIFYKQAGVNTDPQIPAIFSNFVEMLSSILFMDTTAACLARIFKYVEGYSRAAEAPVREKVQEALLALLRKFVEYKTRETGPKPDKRFVDMGKGMAILIPRITDPTPTTRRAAVECVQMMLYIDQVLRKTNGAEGEYQLQPPEELRALTQLKERAEHGTEANELYAVAADLATIIAQMVLAEELASLLVGTLRGLTDPEVQAASGACVLLNGLLRVRGAELAPRVKDLIAGFMQSMSELKSEMTMNGTLHSLRSLAHHHLPAVLDEILTSPVPHPPHVVKSLQVLAKDETLVVPMVTHLTHILNNSQVIEEKMDPKTKGRIINEHSPKAMSTTTAVGEILATDELDEVIKSHYYLFISTLLLRIGTANSSTDASAQLVTTLKAFCAKEDALQAAMDANDNWKRCSTAEYGAAVTDLTRAICKTHPDEMNNIFQFLLPYVKANFTQQRIVTAAVFAEFVNHTKNDKVLLGQLVNCLLASLVDSNVKMHALVGLGNVGAAGAVETNKYAPTILDALMSSIDDANEDIAMEAMNGLAKIFELVEESRITPTLVNICLRIRPAFEKPNDKIRAAAIAMFGSLHRFGRGQAAHIFNDQIHNNLTALVLHLNDENPKVQAAAKGALRKLGPLIGSDEITTFFNGKVLDENRQLQYEDFLNDLSKLLIAAFAERLNSYVLTCIEYFKSNWTVLRANAALFAGFLLGNLPVEQRRGINLNPVMAANALVLLLKEKSPEVRKKAAYALSMLTNY